MAQSAPPIAPPAPDPATGARWEETRRRRRLLEGQWLVDLEQSLVQTFGRDRVAVMGRPRTTINAFSSAISQLAVLYDRDPIIQHADPAAVEQMDQLTDDAGIWPLAVELQTYVLGLREAAYRLDVSPDSQGRQKLRVRLVTPELLWGAAHPETPDVPHTMIEYRLRQQDPGNADSGLVWTRDHYSVSDLDAPIYRVEDAEGRTDLSARYGLAGLSDQGYPYRFADGVPFLPWSLYHARKQSRLFDGFRGKELADGSLHVAELLHMWTHLVLDASWPQKWGKGVRVPGATPDSSTGVARVAADPASVLIFEDASPSAAGSLGQWAPGGDPEALGRSIRAYSDELLAQFELAPADVSRTHTDARSGYAISISRESQRHVSRRVAVPHATADKQTLSISAALWNAAGGGQQLPEEGWGIDYPGLPLSLEERRVVLEEYSLALDYGVTSKAVLLARLEGITEDQARARLVTFAEDRRQFG